jgi:lactoylglutathione lyase
VKINYVIIFVSNMKISVSFYKFVIGLSLKFETPEWSEFETEGATVALHKSNEARKSDEDNNPEPPGSCRPGFSVPNLDAFHKRMIENNVKCKQEPKEVFGARVAQYIDPDGLSISVSEDKRGR